MEGRKQTDSSLAALFGAKDSYAATSTEVLRSILAPHSMVSSGESLHLLDTDKQKGSDSQASNTKAGSSGCSSDDKSLNGQEQSRSRGFGPNYQGQVISQPFPYSSSIYYGGPDICPQPKSAQNPGVTLFSKGDDDLSSASRGNWWRGSYHY